MAKTTGTVKWFSNRKGFGFIAPTSDNAPTTEEIFVHHSALVMTEGAYRTLAEDAEVEFDTETDANGKLKAVNVTGVGGAPLVPPPRHKRRKPEKKDAPAESNGNNGGSKPAKAPREPPFHHVIKDDVKAKITSIPLVRNTVDVAIGGARIKLGQGGYASLVEASGQIGEGSFTCNEDAKVDFTWERCLEVKDGNWVVGDVAKLLSGVSLTDDAVGPVKPDETPAALWGADTPDPKDLFADNGFKMKKVILTRPAGRGRRGGGKGE